MEHHNDLDGHQLKAWTTSVEEGCKWAYTIDDGPMFEGGPKANLPEAMVLDEAIGHARGMLKRMYPGQAVESSLTFGHGHLSTLAVNH